VGGSREERMQEVLRELRMDNPGVEGAVLISSDAMPLVGDTAEAAEEVLSAMASAVLSTCERAADELARGPVQQVYLWGVAGDIAMVRVREDLLLACLVQRRARGGDTLQEVVRCARRLAGIV